MEFLRPDLPSKCSYNENKSAPNPHGVIARKKVQKIYPNILQVVGNTPLVKLNRIPQSMGIKCDVLAKCEFQNPGGSVKDRIAVSMVENAEKMGLLKPGSTVIEPTSGNTGIALAMACAVKGYKCICVVSEKASTEKRDILKSLGAEVVVTPDTPIDDPNGVFIVSEQLEKSIPGGIILQQFHNPHNPLAHYYGTALEIFDQCDGKVDMIVMGVGTGGTLSGVGRRMKELIPSCLIVGADPIGSLIAEPQSLNKTDVTYFEVEGMGHNFDPSTLDKSMADFWVKVEDKSAFEVARRLHKEEGILCGSSAGCIMSGALEAAKRLKESQKCVVIIPDGVGNYLSKFVSDYWMESKKLIPRVNHFNHWWWDNKIADLSMKPYVSIQPTSTCKDATKILKNKSLDVLLCIDGDEILKGILYSTELVNKILTTAVTLNDPITKVLSQKFRTVTMEAKLAELSHIFEKERIAVVVEESAKVPLLKLKGLLFAADFLYYVSNKDPNSLQM